MRPEVVAYIALGANLGQAQVAVLAAIQDIAASDGVRLTHRSSLYSSAPVDSSGPDYVNAVVQVQTSLSAPALLTQLQRLEEAAGRQRPYRNAPRTLDLDLLLFGDACIDSAQLTVPHPRMWQRAFVVVPLAEIAPHRVSAAQLQAVALQSLHALA